MAVLAEWGGEVPNLWIWPKGSEALKGALNLVTKLTWMVETLVEVLKGFDWCVIQVYMTLRL